MIALKCIIAKIWESLVNNEPRRRGQTAENFGNVQKTEIKQQRNCTINSAWQNMLLWKRLCGGGSRGFRLFFWALGLENFIEHLPGLCAIPPLRCGTAAIPQPLGRGFFFSIYCGVDGRGDYQF